MIENLKDAITHARETASKLRKMTSITNGKPYEECLECAAEHEQLASWLTELQERREAGKSSDLISREALKEECANVVKGSNNSDFIVPPTWNKAMELIDNARAVDLWQMRQEATENALKKAEVLYGRPQGEWIKEPNGKTTDIYRCSICGRSIMLCKDADLSKYPFCHCGADMRTRENKDV